MQSHTRCFCFTPSHQSRPQIMLQWCSFARRRQTHSTTFSGGHFCWWEWCCSSDGRPSRLQPIAIAVVVVMGPMCDKVRCKREVFDSLPLYMWHLHFCKNRRPNRVEQDLNYRSTDPQQKSHAVWEGAREVNRPTTTVAENSDAGMTWEWREVGEEVTPFTKHVQISRWRRDRKK